MIESIGIKNVASYDPDDGVQINDLKKVNFFFGFNGSGKSTIVKYLYNLSLESSLRVDDFDDCSQNGYDPANHQILVFDENFTDVNFNQNTLLKGVFSLNEENDVIDGQITNEEDLIKLYKSEEENKEKIIEAIEKDKAEKKRALLDFCWSKRNTFSTFSKISLEYSGSKPNHLQKINDLLQTPLVNGSTIEQLTTRYRQLYEKEITEITHTIKKEQYREIRHIENELEVMLQEVIIGNEDVDIASLIKSLNARSWVETGVAFLEQTEDTCPFCQQQTINEGLKKQFGEYFDETYKEKIELLTKLFVQYKEKAEAFLAEILVMQKAYNPDNILSSSYVKLQKLFELNVNVIEEKIKNSNEKKSLTSLLTHKPDLSSIIKAIKDNNATFSELDDNRKNLIADIWLFMADESKNEIDKLTEKEIKYLRITTLADELIVGYNTKTVISKQAIETLRGQTVNTKEAVDDINLILKNSGFESFEIAEKDTINNISQYFLKRPNSSGEEPIFKSLSEGEKSLISFLYFYQLCVGTDDIQNNGSKKKIIIIDDPVSSLDSQALFVVSTLIHQLILRKANDTSPNRKTFKNETIAQLFILTHNLYFYKEVSFEKRPMCTDYWHYKIDKINNQTTISGRYNKMVSDDYSMLWQTTKELKANLPQDSILNVVIANTMRRIIESYVNFIGLGKDSWSSVLSEDQTSSEYYLKCAFISAINDESHKITALDSVYYQKLSNEQPQILFNVFKNIFKAIGKEHYEMMMDEEIND